MEATLDDVEVKKFLGQMDSRLKDIKDGRKNYLGLLSAIVFRDIMDHFSKEQGPEGPWEKWSKSYREYMEEQGKQGNKILQDSGRLRQSFLPTNVRKSSEGILWFNPAKTKKGFPYASYHDEDAETTRPFMWLSGDAMDDICSQTLAFMLEKGI